MTRILICNYEYPPLGGGGGVATALLAAELAKRHEVTVLTSQGLGMPPASLENGVRIVRVPVFGRRQAAAASLLSMLAYIPMAIKAGRRLLETDGFDIINTHFVLPSGPVGDTLSRRVGIPNVLSVHGGDLYDPTKFTSPHRHALLRAWVRRLLSRAERVVGQSKNTLENLERFYIPDLDSVRIPLGIQRPEFVPASRERLGFAADEVLLVTTGRLVARKAVGQLIASVAAMREKQVRLVVIGAGPQEQLLREESRRWRVEDRVRFMGFVNESEKFQLLQIADIYVTTSQHEGFGLVFLEAMHCGLPIVSYDHGGQTDFLRDGETGFVIPLNDQELFRERCLHLIRRPRLRKTMGKTNRSLVARYYINTCARSYEEIFEETLARESGRGAPAAAGA